MTAMRLVSLQSYVRTTMPVAFSAGMRPSNYNVGKLNLRGRYAASG
jgi:hypothetical protein